MYCHVFGADSDVATVLLHDASSDVDADVSVVCDLYNTAYADALCGGVDCHDEVLVSSCVRSAEGASAIDFEFSPITHRTLPMDVIGVECMTAGASGGSEAADEGVGGASFYE